MTEPVEQPGLTASLPHVTYISLPSRILCVGDRRLEGETYLTGGYALRLKIETSGAPASRLMELADIWQPPRLKGIQVSKDSGVPFLTATQVFDLRPSPRKWLAASRTPALVKRYVKLNWILVTCSGSVADPIVTYSPHSGVMISHDLLRVVPKKETDLGYLYCYLRGRFGKAIARSSRYGKIIKHLEVEHLEAIPVPVVEEWLRPEFDERIRRVFTARDQAFQMISEAEGLYAKELGVEKLEEADETGYIVPASQMFGNRRRLDGYHYNPRAEVVLKALRESGKQIQRLSEVTKHIFGVPRFKHVYTDQGMPYLDSEDIFKVNPEVSKFIPDGAKRNAAEYHVERGWLLMACSGQIYGLNGSVVLADRWHEKKIVSNHVVRIVPRTGTAGIGSGYLQMALGHPTLGRPLVLRLAFGMEVPEIDPNDLSDFPVVRLGRDVETRIADLVERASGLRMDADDEENKVVLELDKHLERLLRIEAPVAPQVARRSLGRPEQPEHLVHLSMHPRAPKRGLEALMKVDPARVMRPERQEKPARTGRKTVKRRPGE